MNLPKNIIEAARARVRETTGERLKAIKAIEQGRPLDAEPDPARKVRRLQYVMRVGPQQAEAMTHYDKAAAAAMADAPPGLGGKEIIQGTTVDFLGVAFLETAIAAARTVARVAFSSGRPQGSGFMVSPQLFLTNNHVIASAAEARQFVLEFDYQLDYLGQPREATRYELAPEAFFLTNPETDLDFTLVAVGRRLNGRANLADFGYCPLLARDDKHVLGELVNVVQHPEGNYKQAVIRENQLVTRLPRVLHYVADTMPGSSGSPVFNDQWEVVALHHWGEPFTETRTPNGKPVRHDVNEGVRVSAILRAMTAMRGQTDGPRRTLLDAVLQPTVQFPSSLSEAIIRNDTDAGNGVPSVRTSEDGTATWTIPLRVSVNIGSLPKPPPPGPADLPAPPAAPAEAEKVQIDPNYSNRSGYNPRFLKGFVVPKPSLSAAQKKLAVKLTKPKAGKDSHELQYTHFSLVMNGARRMAFFTACNIDGASWIDIDRDTGLPKEMAEASETWYADPRIADEGQCEQGLYDKQQPKRLFDRGHLVRRLDPCWGTKARATRANADTFHFTNCTPQASSFNSRAKFWQGIEKYILEDNAVADDDKIIVFTGPVFGSKDKPYRYVKVPAKFWKIIVRVENGKLLATALLADQSKFLKTLPESLSAEALEAWDDTTKVEEFLSSVKEIETLTGLNFGSLRNHDTKPGGEAAGRLLTNFSDIPLRRRG